MTKFEKTDTGATAVNATSSLSAPAHTLDGSAIVEAYQSDTRFGLHNKELPALLERYGPNQLKPPPAVSLLSVLLRNILNAMSLVLIAAMAVSFGTFDWISGGVIAALIALNVVTGTVSQYKAEKTVAALESVGAPQAMVIRHDAKKGTEGTATTIASTEVVPGDILVLRIGDIVPADARILEHSSLETDEMLLTGESMPVAKNSDKIAEHDCPVGDRINMVFSGSTVTKGRAKAIVTETGMHTQLGAIAESLSQKEKVNKTGFALRWHKFLAFLGLREVSPLQHKLNALAYTLLGFSLVIALIVVASTAFVNVPLSIATYAVAAAVSLLPASLIAVVALSLAQASIDLSKRNALVRRMDAIEAMAGIDGVCSDKTGTITLGRSV